MPKVLFLETRTPQAANAPTYEAGRVYEMPQRSIDHWVTRGVATTDPVRIAALLPPAPAVDESNPNFDAPPPVIPIVKPGETVVTVAPDDVPDVDDSDAGEAEPAAPDSTDDKLGAILRDLEIDADWKESMAWPAKRSLASSLSADPIRNGDDANAAIEAEIARRLAG